MKIHPTTDEDAESYRPEFPHAYPDRWRPNASSFAAHTGGELAAMAVSAPNRTHPTSDLLFVHVREPFRRRGVATALIDRIRTRTTMPLSVKAYHGTPARAFYQSLGAVVNQVCPPETVDTARPDVRDWITRSASETVSGNRFTTAELTQAWTTLYEVVHAAWSPTAPHTQLVSQFSSLIGEKLDRARSRFALRDGHITAAGFVFADPVDAFGNAQGAELEAIVESLEPDSPAARAQVAACMAGILAGADGAPVVFDGHVGDPHFHPLLKTIPGVTGRTLDLLEIPGTA